MSKDLKSVKSATPRPVRSEKAIASAYVAQARRQYSTSTSDLEIDDEPQVSFAENGAWVAAWVWVAQEETVLYRKRRA
ncbi:MAG: hypothetical protein ABSE55_09900 [Terracidiphilus sp.]|jgi:hypothetical protein